MELSNQGLPIPALAKQNRPNAEFTTRPYANYHPSIWGDRFLYSFNSMVNINKCMAKQNRPNAEFTTRPYANYHPSIWGDRFLYSFNSMEVDDIMNRRLEELKERVGNKLVGSFDNFSNQLDFIDAIQRLGVGYHFKNEIDSTLKKIYETIYCTHHLTTIDDLYTVSLSFRLLRQQGYHVSSDIFGKFKDRTGKFEETLTNDVRGALSLYEAAHLSVRGEDILDEALEFTRNQLNFVLPNLNGPLKEQVTHALEMPIRTSSTRLEAMAYLAFYEKTDFHDKNLIEFAKLDFNLLQKMHQNELSEITRWWEELDFARKLPYARDRVVECYFWMLGVYFEPDYSLARKILSKVALMITVIDDTYDEYGTLEELALFTNAVERWNINTMAQLPEYMQILQKGLFDVYNMIEEEMTRLGRSYRVHYAKEAMKNLVRAFFEEAKWCNAKFVPTFEEYMKVALVSVSNIVLATTSFVGMGDIATEEAFKWVSNHPLVLRSSCVIFRLQNDMVGHKELVASAVECYMKQNNVSEEEASTELKKKITNAWKDINAECLRPTKVPMPLIMPILNLTRMITVMYNGEDGYTNNSTRIKDFVTSMLIDSVPIDR